MEYKLVDNIKVSRLIYGTGNMKITGSNREEAVECLEMAYQAGFRTFDSAYSYGEAEKNIGYWLDKYGHREDITIIDKGCNPGQLGSDDIFSAETIKSQMTQSLERMNVKYVDFYLLHRDDAGKPVDEVIETLNECMEYGRIKSFGVSNWSMDRIIEANEYSYKHNLKKIAAVSPCYSLAKFENDPWGGSITISGDANKEFRKWLEKEQYAIFNYSALGRGFLSGKFKTYEDKKIEECLWWAPIKEYYSEENVRRLSLAEKVAKESGYTVSQISLAWLFNKKLNLFPIVSPGSRKHMEELISSIDINISEYEIKDIE